MRKKHLMSAGFGLAACFLLIDYLAGQDWPSRGSGISHNPVVNVDKALVDFELSVREESTNVNWSVQIGMGLDSEPAISNGLVWIGGSNWKRGDSDQKEDAGVIYCFRESNGELLYKYVSPRREDGREYDWPGCGITSTPFIEDDRLYFCTNRCETICLDIGPLIDGTGLPLEVWKVEMREQFGVYPGVAHIGSRHVHCSPAVWGDFVYVNTTHTVRPYLKHELPLDAPPPPSLICFEKKTGHVKWSDNTPGNSMLGPQWNNPTVLRAGGRHQVVMGQGDGWVRSFDCLSGELIWKFDINEKSARLEFGKEWPDSRHLRQVISEPVFHNGRLYLVAGYEYEFGNITGHLCCIDPAKTGDLSSELLSDDKIITVNPNSGLIWEFAGSPSGPDGNAADSTNPNVMHSSLGSVAVQNGLVIAVDLGGSVHCLDEQTGKRHWSFETYAAFFGSPLILGNTIIVANQEGDIFSIPLGTELKQDNIRVDSTHCLLQTSLVFANNVVYLTDYSNLYAIPCRDLPKDQEIK